MSNTATKLCFFWKNIVIKFGVSEKSRTFALAFRKYFRMSTKRKSSLKFLHTDKVVQELRARSVFQVRHAGYMTQSNDRGEYDNKRTFWQTKKTLALVGENLRSEYFERNIKIFYNGEFDPGSGWTLATGLTHASRGAACIWLARYDGDRRTGE